MISSNSREEQSHSVYLGLCSHKKKIGWHLSQCQPLCRQSHTAVHGVIRLEVLDFNPADDFSSIWIWILVIEAGGNF